MVRRREDEERKGGGVFWPFSWAAAERLLKWFLSAPDAWLARAGLAAAFALNLAWLAAAVAMPPQPRRGAALSGSSSRPALDMRDALYSPRSMITGFKNILAPDFAAVEPAPEAPPRPEGSAEASTPGLGLSMPDAAGGEPGAKDSRKGDGDKADAAAAAAAAGSAAGGAAVRGVMGGLAPMRSGGAASSSGAGSSAATGGAAAAAGALARDRQATSLGRKPISRTPVRGRGAMDQLRFAQDQSNAGRRASSSERSYQAADTAFQGQTAQPGGIPATSGAPTTAAPPPGPGEGGPKFVPYQPNTCPSGYHLQGNLCQPLETQNVTPYQGLVDLARKFLIAAAVLAALGIFLLVKGGPSGQFLGGLLLGAAMALALAAMAIGNSIEKDFGQKPQKKAIDAGASRSLQGQQ